MSKRNKFGSILIAIFCLFRKKGNLGISNFISNKFSNVPEINFEKDYATMSLMDFKKKIMSFPYKWDPLKGVIDFTFLNPKYFFWNDLPYGRDCDDFSYMWYLWNRFNEVEAYQYAIMPDKEFKKAHVICITKEEDTFTLFDYSNVYVGNSISDLMYTYWESRYKKDKQYKSISYARLRKSEHIDKLRKRFI